MNHFSIILPTTPKSPRWSVPFRISGRDIIRISHLSYAYYMYHHPTLLDLITTTIFFDEYK
jgi:hypothetical protein